MQVEQAPGSVPTDARDQTVTQRRRAGQQLDEAEEKYRALVERAVEGVFRTSRLRQEGLGVAAL
jgi:PAS domain-containing protein